MINKVSYITGYTCALLIAIAMSSLSSCTRGDAVAPDPSAAEGYMKIYFDMPEFERPPARNSDGSTKAMDDTAEKMIDGNLLNILVFRVGNGRETFCYKSPVQGSVEYDSERGKAAVVVKLVKSGSTDEKFRILVIANHDLSGVTMIENITTKSEIIAGMHYSMPDKWNADSHNYTPLPMWGESDLLVISSDMPAQTISMYRALARIDVGLNFAPGNGGLSEYALGVDGFKLKEIKVYRTYNTGSIAPAEGMYGTVNIPAGATRRPDGSPVDYRTASPAGEDSFIREIYVPEAEVPAGADNDNIHCVVVGGYYKGNTLLTYYRLDFSTDGNRTYLPLLRNHRYILNIIQVRGAGFATADQALRSSLATDNIDYDLIVWDETIHNMEVQGKYYFGLDDRDLTFDYQAGNLADIKYQTNYPLSEPDDPLELSWQSGIDNPGSIPPFSATWDRAGKGIVIRTQSVNKSNRILTDVLIVKAGSFTMRVNVKQKYLIIYT